MSCVTGIFSALSSWKEERCVTQHMVAMNFPQTCHWIGYYSAYAYARETTDVDFTNSLPFKAVQYAAPLKNRFFTFLEACMGGG